MTGAPEPSLPEGEMFMVDAPMLLADHGTQVDAMAGFSLNQGGEQLLVKVKAVGRWNKSGERGAVEFAVHPEQAMVLVDQLLFATMLCANRAAARRQS